MKHLSPRSSDTLSFYGPFALAAVFVAGGWAWAWSALHAIRQPLIIHFSDYNGINQIGGMPEVNAIALTGLIIIGLDLLLARALRVRDPRWAVITGATALFLGALLFMALAAIISVNQ